MQNNKNLIIHVGLPKTGTSFLQSKIFPNLEKIYHSGNGDPNVYSTPLACLMNLNHIYRKKNLSFDFVSEKNKINNFIQNLDCEKILFSSEGLTGSNRYDCLNNIFNTNILKMIFPEAKIIFMFRNQSNWLESIYNQRVIKEKKNIKINNYLGYKNSTFVKGKYLHIEAFNWLNIYENYVKNFESENVLALPYELMKEDMNLFLSKFYEFSEIEPYHPKVIEDVNPKENVFIAEVNLLLRFYLNSIEYIKVDKIKKIIRQNDKGFKKLLEKIKIFNLKIDYSKEILTLEQREKILKIHEESNKKLSELINIDLGQYGYY